MPTPRVVLTTPTKPWRPARLSAAPAGPVDVHVTEDTTSTWRGWGGCFNELGWVALKHLSARDRAAVLDRFFGPGSELGFTYCRLPIGANDYSLDWYSYDEHPGDFAMAKFSIERDRQHLLPYVQAARKRDPALTLFASPWSPPTWLKSPAVCNYGDLIDTPRHSTAYATYFVKYVQAYAAEGVTIHQIHPQNEPVSTQKFPSCVIQGPQFARFIGTYLGPALEQAGLDTEIWFGTINGPEVDERRTWSTYHHYAGYVLEDPKARPYIRGVSYQWAGKYAVHQTRTAHPDLPIIQSENECGDGRNTWEYAGYVAGLIHHYLSQDAVGYVYWNMVLEPFGKSSWGWQQNSLVTVDPATRTATLNPEYHIFRHYTAIRPGDRRLRLERPWNSCTVAYRSTDHDTVVVRNPYPDARTIRIGHGGRVWSLALPVGGIATITFAHSNA